MEVKDKKNLITNNNYFKVAAIMVVIISAFIAYIVSINNTVSKWDDKVYSGVYINDTDLSGMNKDEVINIITEKYLGKLNDKKIKIAVGDNKLEYKYSDIEATFDLDKAAEEALSYGKNESVFKKSTLIKNRNNEKINIEIPFSYNEDKLISLQAKIKKSVNINPKEANIKINKGNINITPEAIGYKVEDDVLDSKMRESINGDLSEDTNLSFELKEDQPSRTAEALAKIKPQFMSTFTTSFATSDYNRSYNIELVTSLVNGTVLMPGEEFSYSTISQKGRGKYQTGIAYENEKPVPSEGGGICQGSTTLYRAVMKANIRSTERHNHSLPVGYAQLGLDATVAWGYLDYKFKNPYDFPIYIEGITENKTVTFNIYGDPSALGNKTYEMVSDISGKQATSYQVTYENGVEVNKELIAKDTYK